MAASHAQLFGALIDGLEHVHRQSQRKGSGVFRHVATVASELKEGYSVFRKATSGITSCRLELPPAGFEQLG